MKRLAILISLLALTACGSMKQISYLQDIESGESLPIGNSYEVTIKPADVLSIMVSVANGDANLARPFNIVTSDAKQISDGSAGASSMSYQHGYLVDPEGYINFPIFGKIQVVGMTRNQLIAYLENRIREENYIKDPIVTANFLNLKVYVLGEVNRPGEYSIPSNRMTLFEALSLAGDLTVYGKRKNIAVIREDEGVRKVVYLDLTSKDIFMSPYFYLKQNDVVYVQPNKRRAEQGAMSPLWSTIISGGSLLVSLATLLVTVLR